MSWKTYCLARGMPRSIVSPSHPSPVLPKPLVRATKNASRSAVMRQARSFCLFLVRCYPADSGVVPSEMWVDGAGTVRYGQHQEISCLFTDATALRFS
jgi:hypothetical protein